MARKKKKETDVQTDPIPETTTAVAEAPPVVSETPTELPPAEANGAHRDPPENNGNGNGHKPAAMFSYPVAAGTYIQASVWARTVTTNSGTFVTHDVSVRKRWKDPQTGEWKSLYNFRGSELYALNYAIQRAMAWIMDQRASDTPF